MLGLFGLFWSSMTPCSIVPIWKLHIFCEVGTPQILQLYFN